MRMLSMAMVQMPVHFGRIDKARNDLCPMPAPHIGHRREFPAPFAGGVCRERAGGGGRGSLQDRLAFQRAKLSELRIRWAIQVWICAAGRRPQSLSGKPRRPSTTAARSGPGFHLAMGIRDDGREEVIGLVDRAPSFA